MGTARMSGGLRKIGVFVVGTVLVVGLAHAGAWLPALRGAAIPGAPLDDGDTLYSLRLADDAWAWLGQVGLFQVPVQARTLNLLDLALAVWPARLVGGSLGLALLHVGLVAAAAVAGGLYARALGAGWAGAAAGAVCAGASGMVLTVVGIGQYPQALVIFPLAWFAGVARAWRGERGGVPLAIFGGAGAVLAYWLFAPILALGAAVLCAGAWTVAWPAAPGLARRIAAVLVGIVVLAAPWAWPVWSALTTESKIASVPWGTSYFAAWPEAAAHVVGEVRFATLVSPAAGWLPALPLLVAAGFGVRRERWPWVLLAAVGAILVLGPLPMSLLGAPIPGLRAAVPAVPRWMDPAALSTAPRVRNLPYLVVFQWLPGASRMRHPVRWGVLVIAGLVPIVAAGVDRIGGRRAWGVVAAGALWAAIVGPWPLPERPFPGAAFERLRGCSEVLYPGLPERPADRVDRLDAIHGRPRYPRRVDPGGGFGDAPDPEVSTAREAALQALLATGDASGIPAGACLVVDPAVNPAASAALTAEWGEPERVALPAHTVGVEEGEIEVWRGPS
jgi:hypothetical protein